MCRSSDLASALVKWRPKNGLPVLKGTFRSGPVATISGYRGQIRRIVAERGLDPLPEMTRSGMKYPGRERGDVDDEDEDTNNLHENVQVNRREGKRRSRRPDFFGSPSRG